MQPVPAEVHVLNCALAIRTNEVVKTLVLEERVSFTSPVTADRVRLNGSKVEIEPGGQTVRLNALELERPVAEFELFVRGTGALFLAGAPNSLKVTLEGTPGGTPEIRFSAPPTSLKEIRVEGDGHVVVDTNVELDRPQLNSGVQVLHLNFRAAVLSPEGEVGILRADAESVFRGAKSKPLRVKSMGNVSGAELENLHVYDLRIVDLASLRVAERLVPWIPNARKARREELKMPMGEEPAAPVNQKGGRVRAALERMKVSAEAGGLVRQKRAHFWATLSAIVKEKQAPGNTQSDVRLAAMRARRLAAGFWTRERFLLRLYALVGYGERVLQPLFVYGVLSATVAAFAIEPPKGIGYWSDHPGLFLERWRDVAVLPLSFYRVLSKTLPEDPLWATIPVRVAGVALIALSLLAMRKVVKPD